MRRLLALLVLLAPIASRAEWERAFEPRAWTFPADHGAHPAFRTEWWYLTANLTDDDGARLGAHLTFFRHGVSESPPAPGTNRSAWRLGDIHFAHFGITDARARTFRHFETIQRPALGRAGALPGWFHVWNGGWFARQCAAEPFSSVWYADGPGVALSLVATAAKPIVLQGDRGLSAKSDAPGNASHYYSFPRLRITGTLVDQGKTRRVTGEGWLDREFSTSALTPGQRGWDWFCIQLNTREELMIYLMRNASGGIDRVSEATLIAPDGTTRRWPARSFSVEPTGTWKSPHTGATYPSGWRLRIPEADCALTISPILPDQELRLAGLGALAYWEGACDARGTLRGVPVSGCGYTELTGYAGDLARAMR
jgi:predicted secreted hydrolase